MTNFTKTTGEGDDHQGVADKIGIAGHSPAHVDTHHGPDHHPHVLPLRVYFMTWGALMVFTAITVGVSYINLGGSWNLAIALIVATMKATLVAALFMHLFFDAKFHAIIFGFSLIFLGIFIVFTMYDTNHRGQTDAAENERPVDISTPFSGGNKSEAASKKLHSGEIQKMASPADVEMLTHPPHSN